MSHTYGNEKERYFIFIVPQITTTYSQQIKHIRRRDSIRTVSTLVIVRKICSIEQLNNINLHHLLHSWHVHDAVIKWRHFPCYWPFVRGIHRSPVNSPHKGQWRGVLMFSLICVCKPLSKQWWGWWFEMRSRPLWRHRNVYLIFRGWERMVVATWLPTRASACCISTIELAAVTGN